MISVDVCLLSSDCPYKEEREIKGKLKVRYKCCTWLDNCNQKRSTTMKGIVHDWLQSKSEHKILNLAKKFRNPISRTNS
jgi:HD superfamily phosphohydrolase YqeK